MELYNSRSVGQNSKLTSCWVGFFPNQAVFTKKFYTASPEERREYEFIYQENKSESDQS